MARQAILLCAAFAIPMTLLATGWSRALLAWVSITLSVRIFDTAIVTNLPAGRIVGLLYLPYALVAAPAWLRLRPAKAWILNFLYLGGLGIAFGYIWPDTTGQRPFTMTASGRTIVYTIRLISDLSLTVFVTREVQRPGQLGVLGCAIVLGASLTALAGIFNFITRIDPYFAITDMRDLAGNLRARGLSYEPRRAGGIVCQSR